MTRRTAALWLVGLSAVLLNLALSCPTRGQEIARVAVSSGAVTVTRGDGVIVVVITSEGETTTIEIPVTGGSNPPAGPDAPDADPMEAAVERAFAGIPTESRPAIRSAALKEINEAIAVVDRLRSVEDAVRVILSRTIFALGDVGPIFAAQLSRLASALHEAPAETPIKDRLEALKAILEAGQ